MKTSKVWLLILCGGNTGSVLGGFFSKSAPPSKPSLFHDAFHTPTSEKSLGEIFFPAAWSLATAIYGSALVNFGHECPGQLRCMTMFRATGHEKLLKALEAAKRNFRDAKFAAVWRAPSFLMAHRSMKALDDRIAMHRKVVEKTKAAKADGVVTKWEARDIARLEKAKMRLIKRDMRRMIKAASNIKVVFKALDFDEIRDITKGFLFQFLAVLSAGDEEKTNGLGRLVGRWCLFLNLGSLALETTRRLDFPIAKMLVRKKEGKKDEEIREAVMNTGKGVVFAFSGYLVVMKNAAARRLNSALLSSAVVMRGLRTFVQTMLDWDEDDDDWIWPQVGEALNGFIGAALMIGLATKSWQSQHSPEEGEEVTTDLDDAPTWVKVPLKTLEKSVDVLAEKVDNFM